MRDHLYVGALVVGFILLVTWAGWLVTGKDRTDTARCLAALAGSTSATDTLRVYRANADCIRLVEK